MNTVEIAGVRRQLPANWGELTRRQLLRLVPLLFRSTNAVTVQVLLLCQLFNLPGGQWFRLTDFDIASHLYLVRWLTEPSRLVKQLLPRLGRWWRPLVGPGDWLAGVQVWEFANAEVALRKWIDSQAEADLNRLVAVLYRPRRWFWWLLQLRPEFNGDTRQAFNEKRVAARMQLVAKLPLAERHAVLLYYLGCRAGLEKAYHHVFDGDEGNAKDPNPWLTLIGRLPNEKFGTLDQIGTRPLHTVLLFTNQFIRDAPTDEK